MSATVLKIGFTGTRNGMTGLQQGAVEGMLCDAAGEFHHGDCVGADADAHEIALGLGLLIVGHPPTDRKLRAFCDVAYSKPAKPYLERNRDIVDAVDLLVAAPGEMAEQVRSGTWSTVRYARKRGKRIWIFFPDGTFKI